MITVRSLAKSYGERQVLSDVDLDLRPEESSGWSVPTGQVSRRCCPSSQDSWEPTPARWKSVA